jgi:MFS superfamily sulfate permease-like transporter
LLKIKNTYLMSQQISTPKDGLAGLKQNFGSDLIAGILVSLLALPLSLGIAAACDFPNPMYGVLTAIIGGMIVSFFAGSVLTIKGPAAGLIVIVAGSVAAFGGGEIGWHLTLGAIVVAALLQILFGILKLGKLADFFPLSAVHGMLAAIGIIIISKQLHILLGVNPVNEAGKPMVEPLELLAAVPATLQKISANTKIVITGITSLILVLGIPMIKNKWIKKIPVPMIVLLVAIPLGSYLGLKDIKGALLKFDKPFLDLVNVNVSFGGMKQIGTFIQYVILFALIGSLESLLTAKAVDLLDPFKRKSNFNKDLIAVGTGNVLAGVLGGLPMISEVARSSANVSNGGKTRWANFFHGLILLVFMLLLVPVLEMIPKAALAAMLIGVGIKLAHPKEFIHVFKIGKEQLAIFITTIVFTLCVDLLVGIAAGMLLKVLIHLLNGAPLKSLFKAPISVSFNEDNYLIEIENAAIFTNYLGIKNKLDAIPQKMKITIDFNKTKLVDHSVMENIHAFEHDYAAQGGSVYIIGLHEHTSFSNHQLAARKK